MLGSPGPLGTSLTMPGADVREVACRLASEGHDLPRNRRHAPGEPAGGAQRGRQRRPAAQTDRRGPWPEQRHQDHHRGQRGKPDQHSLGAGRADGGDQQQAEHDGAGDGADRVGRVDPCDEPAGVLAAAGDRRQRQWEARSPQARRRQDGPEAAHQVELEHVPGARRHSGDDRPVGE